MSLPRRQSPLLGRLLLWGHLFVCLVWFSLLRGNDRPPVWMIHVYLLSILSIQFTWGLTVGVLTGPSRRRRSKLWWCLLTLPLPMYFVQAFFFALLFSQGLFISLLYLAACLTILACETLVGLVLGVRMHGDSSAM
jgi:hypothetical protein